MKNEEEFICSIYFHCNYGKLAEIGFSKCYYAPDLEYNEEKGVPDFLVIDGSGNASCMEFKGHRSADFEMKTKNDLDQYKKYQRIVNKDNINSICNSINKIDISICYLNYWIDEHLDFIIKEFDNEKISPVVWVMEKDTNSNDIFIQDISNNHTIAALRSLMYEGIRTSERNIHIYIVVDVNTNDYKLNRVLGGALFVLASRRVKEFDLKMLIDTLKSSGVILANNQTLYERIISRLNNIFSDFGLVKSEGDNMWSIRVDITNGRSRTSWTIRLNELLAKYGDQSDLFRFT